jgi:hypothetical protein
MKPGQGYGARTTVPVSQTRTEIEELLTRYGATGFMTGWQETPEGKIAALRFDLGGRRFRIPIPILAGAENAEMQAWRVLLLLLKAVLEAVDRGLIPLEKALLSYVELPSGCTVGQWVEPQLAAVYSEGTMPTLLPGLPALEAGG